MIEFIDFKMAETEMLNNEIRERDEKIKVLSDSIKKTNKERDIVKPMEDFSKTDKCPLCGRSVNAYQKAGTLYHNGTCMDFYGKIECECGLSLKREWTKMRAKDGYIVNNETVFDAWNRLQKKIEPIRKAIPETQDIETIRKDAVAILRAECIGDSEFMEFAKQLGADALAKEIPQKAYNKSQSFLYDCISSYIGKCPSCNELQMFTKTPDKKTYIHRCGECGQAIDWSDAE